MAIKVKNYKEKLMELVDSNISNEHDRKKWQEFCGKSDPKHLQFLFNVISEDQSVVAELTKNLY